MPADASTSSVPAIRIERSECVPPPAVDHRGVAGDEPHLLRRDAELVGEHLGEARLVPLPARLGAGHDVDQTFGAHAHFDVLARHADRRLDVVRKADAGEPAALRRHARRRAGKPRQSASSSTASMLARKFPLS